MYVCSEGMYVCMYIREGGLGSVGGGRIKVVYMQADSVVQ
jgi:hypothetical protein